MHLAASNVGEPCIFPETVEERLENGTLNFIRNPEKDRWDTEKRALYLSKIFQWYAEDFEDTHNSLLDFIIHYPPEADAKFLKQKTVEVRYLYYDRELNISRQLSDLQNAQLAPVFNLQLSIFNVA